MTRWFRSCFLGLVIFPLAACLPPRPPQSSRDLKLRPYSGLPRCRWVSTVADPDIRLKWEWESSPSEVGGHDRDNGRRVCR